MAKLFETTTINGMRLQKGGRLIDHIFIRRGRVYYQKSGEQLIGESKEIVEEKMKEWITARNVSK